jgi:hypothetical protein
LRAVRLIGPCLLAFALCATVDAGAVSPEVDEAAPAPPHAPAEPEPERTEPEAERSEPPPSSARRALNGAAAVVPGVIAHGSGHFVAGERDTAYALLAAEGVGLGMVLGGLTVLALSGASRYLVAPAAAVTALGVGVFGASFAADLYGTLAPDGGAAALVPRTEPGFESELGYRYVSDPRFAYEHFAVQRISWRSGRWRLTPSGWFATNGTNARYRLDGAYRFLGPNPERPGKLSDSIDLVLGGLHQRYVRERFERTGGELGVEARYDLGHIGRTLRGAFFDLGVGFGLATIHYDLRGIEVPNDVDALLLTTFGFGVVLRGRAAPGSLARIYYDHRHDDYAAGWIMPGLGSGAPGHFGAETRWYFTRRVGILAEAQVGSALLGGLSLLIRENVMTYAKRPE